MSHPRPLAHGSARASALRPAPMPAMKPALSPAMSMAKGPGMGTAMGPGMRSAMTPTVTLTLTPTVTPAMRSAMQSACPSRASQTGPACTPSRKPLPRAAAAAGRPRLAFSPVPSCPVLGAQAVHGPGSRHGCDPIPSLWWPRAAGGVLRIPDAFLPPAPSSHERC